MSRKLELCDKLFLEMFKKGRSFLRWKVINHCLLDNPAPISPLILSPLNQLTNMSSQTDGNSTGFFCVEGLSF